jgi:hypothetical protein
MSLPRNQPTTTTSGALNSAVWIEGPMQWKRAKFWKLLIELFVLVRTSYNLAIPRFVNSCKVFCGFLDKGKHDQTKELVGDPGFDYILDTDNEEDRKHRDDG